MTMIEDSLQPPLLPKRTTEPWPNNFMPIVSNNNSNYNNDSSSNDNGKNWLRLVLPELFMRYSMERFGTASRGNDVRPKRPPRLSPPLPPPNFLHNNNTDENQP